MTCIFSLCESHALSTVSLEMANFIAIFLKNGQFNKINTLSLRWKRSTNKFLSILCTFSMSMFIAKGIQNISSVVLTQYVEKARVKCISYAKTFLV